MLATPAHGKPLAVHRLAAVLLGLQLALPLAAAEPAAETYAEALNRKSIERHRGWGDSVTGTRMIIRNRRGQASERLLETRALELADDAGRSLTIVQAPEDAAGIALLVHSWKEKSDDIWLYLPAVKRVKRITSSGRSGYFLGSDFRFGDFTSTGPSEQGQLGLAGEEQLENCFCKILERIYAEDEEEPYHRVRVWIDEEAYRVHRVEYYDAKNRLEKTLAISDYRLHEERHWRAHHLLMQNHLTMGETELRIESIRFGVGLEEDDFNTNALKRAR